MFSSSRSGSNAFTANRFVVSVFGILTTAFAAACGDMQSPTAVASSSEATRDLTPGAANHTAATFSGFTYCTSAGSVCNFIGLRAVRLVNATAQYVEKVTYGSIPCAWYGFGGGPGGSQQHCEYGAQKMDTLANPSPGMSGMGAKVIAPKGSPGVSTAQIQNSGDKGAYTDGSGSFRTTCDLAKMGFIDPIVFPGQKNASHLHMFFGNAGVTESSTPASLRASGNSACRGGTANRTAYWAPALFDVRTSKVITPDYATIYYKTGYNMAPATIKPFPDGLRMIAGNSKATSQSQQPYGISWECRNKYVNSTGAVTAGCPVGDYVRLTIMFPQCWDGKNLDSPDHKSHMAHPIYRNPPQRSSCPSTHPIPLPVLAEHFDFPVTNTADVQYWRLSSDMYSTSIRGGYSAHADWMNGWDPAIMKTIVTQCLNKALDCGVGLLGDGRSLY